MGGSKKAQTIGYKYSLGMHMCLCHGEVDALTQISVGDKELWHGEQKGSGRLSINQPELFGGDSSEGGISGELDVMMGEPSQQPNDYLRSVLGAIPAFKGVVSIVLRQMYLGNNPYLKTWAFRVRRIMKRGGGQAQWYPQKAAIKTHHMNPAHIIYECLTDRDWGMGYAAGDINEASFKAAANTLHAEGFGLSILWQKSTDLQSFIEDIIKHINGALYVERSTGQFALKLIRQDYEIDALPVLDEDNIISISNYLRPTLSELTNTVSVKYWNMQTGTDDTISVQDIALIQQQGAVIGQNLTYAGIADADLAARVAQRDLQTLSNPLIACSITTTRRIAEQFNVGDCFRLRWQDYGIDNLVMRITDVRLGTITDNKITLECAQDVFGIESESFITAAKTLWTPPSGKARPAPNRLLIDAPYFYIARTMGDEVAQALAPTDSYLLAAAQRPSGDSVNARMLVNGEDVSPLDFAPTGLTLEPLSYLDTVLTIEGEDVGNISAGEVIQINDELMQIRRLDGKQATVKRGIYDSLPAKHAAGSRWWAWTVYNGADSSKRISGERANVKILPATLRGPLAAEAAPTDSINLTGRQGRPYPPANVRINGRYYPQNISAPLIIEWAGRNRKQQTADIVLSWTDGNITAEDGVQYELVIKQRGSTVLSVVLDEPRYEHPATAPPLSGEIEISLNSLREGLKSSQTWRHKINIS